MLNNDTMPWYLPDRHPLLWHEARCQLRGKRGYFVMLAYGVALTAVLVASSYFISEMRDAGKQVQAGKALYQVFLVGQLLLVVFLAPSVTAGVMANELEHGLFEQLGLTPLRPFAMVWGKFLGAVTPLLLMTLSGLPVIATGTLCGGIAWQDVLVGVRVGDGQCALLRCPRLCRVLLVTARGLRDSARVRLHAGHPGMHPVRLRSTRPDLIRRHRYAVTRYAAHPEPLLLLTHFLYPSRHLLATRAALGHRRHAAASVPHSPHLFTPRPLAAREPAEGICADIMGWGEG